MYVREQDDCTIYLLKLEIFMNVHNIHCIL